MLLAAMLISAPATSVRAQQSDAVQPTQSASGPAQEQPEDKTDQGLTTIFPHSETSRWWISGQANVIFQAHPGFTAKYSGPHSLDSTAELATSSVTTLYTGYEFSSSLELLFDVEGVQGGGISDALGLAGFTNLDVVRNPSLGLTPYIARALVHKVIALSHASEANERNPIVSIFTKLPERRLEFRVGKFSAADYFDVNSAGSDSHLQFMNWVADNNGSYDYAADTRGYTFGAIAEYQDRGWGLRFGEMLMPKVANGPDLDANLARARSENVELELRPELRKKRQTVMRFLSYVNHANMGSYREANQAFLAGVDATPDITAHRKQGRIKYGFGFNFEQELTDNTRIFGRAGWDEGQNESFAYTEVNQSLEVGGDWRPRRLHRQQDKVGLALMTQGISRVHQQYLALGGQGFLLGDGRLNYAREDIVEGYYTAQIRHGMYAGPDLQWIAHPGYNQDRGPITVLSLRLHLEF